MNQREAFEAWQLDTGRTDPMWLGRGDGGNYGLNDVQAEWDVWQAAWQAAIASQWQPISTAPKDGQAILVSDGIFCHCVEWNDEFDWWAVDDNKLGPFRLRGAAPTHWMPLPPEPTK